MPRMGGEPGNRLRVELSLGLGMTASEAAVTLAHAFVPPSQSVMILAS
jgi:hypothetical protein